MVYKLSKKELYDISMNLKYTRHANVRLVERLGLPNVHHIHSTLYTKINLSPIAYMNTDGCINIALDKYTYIVVKPLEDGYLCITYKEPSLNGYSVFDKYKFALRGYGR